MLNGMAGTALAAKVREQARSYGVCNRIIVGVCGSRASSTVVREQARSYESFAQPLFLLNSGHCEEQVSL